MNLEELRAQWHRASERDRPQDGLKALLQLERLESDEPLWSQRLGETYRRMDQPEEAKEAFVRAFERYLARGFLPRAIAMGKVVGSLDPARGDLLEQALARHDSGMPQPLPLAGFGKGPPPPVRPAQLERAADSSVDEIRFEDAPESSIEILDAEFDSDVVLVSNPPGPLVAIEADEEDEPTPSPPSGPEDAYRAMASLRLFASLSRDALVALANATELVEFVPMAMIIVRDERAFALYAIVSGSARVTLPGGRKIRLQEGDVFGEALLLDEGQRQADVKAETPLVALRIDKRALGAVIENHPEVEDALFDLLARRLVTNLMHTSPLFAAFDQPVRLELAQMFEVRRAQASTVLAERGRRSDGLYILLAGNVLAEPEQGPATRIARGTTFGHRSLLGGTADVTIRAVTESVLLRMPAAGFFALAAHYPPALAHLAETASEPLPESQREP